MTYYDQWEPKRNLFKQSFIGIGKLILQIWNKLNRRELKEGKHTRVNPKRKRLVNRTYFRIYYSGSYAWLEIDFGKIAHGEFVLLLGCVDKFVNWTYNKSQL